MAGDEGKLKGVEERVPFKPNTRGALTFRRAQSRHKVENRDPEIGTGEARQLIPKGQVRLIEV